MTPKKTRREAPPAYRATILACYGGYVAQAICNNFVPLLFVHFAGQYDLSLARLTLLVTLNFAVQLAVDALSPLFVDKIGYRSCAVAAHVFCGAGMASLAALPSALSSPYAGLLLSVVCYAVGGGLLEVLVSPIVEACPTKEKEKAMSMLHSFYCWGHMAVVILSTAFFVTIGIARWQLLAIAWAVLMLANAVAFTRVPIYRLHGGGRGLSLRELFTKKAFWAFVLVMVCAGASEQAVVQWASAFAERGLGVAKSVGDLAGPLMFACMMGVARAWYGKRGERVQLRKFMMLSAGVCVAAYMLMAFSPWPALALAGCGLCGLSVGIMWPGAFSLAAAGISRGGTALFAYLALAGDLGCGSGPTVVGLVSDALGGRLSAGILAAALFPAALFVAVAMLSGRRRNAY